MRRSPRLVQALRWTVTLALLSVLLAWVDVGEAAGLIADARVDLLGIAIGLALADRVLMIAKWYPLLKIQLPAVGVWTASRSYLAAGFAGVFLPSSIGSDVLRTLALGRGRKAAAEVGASVVAERLLGLVGLGGLCCVALALALRRSIEVQVVIPWALSAMSVAVLLLAAPYSQRLRALERDPPGGGAVRSRVRSVVHRLFTAYGRYRGRGALLATIAGLSALEQMVPVIVLWLVAHSLGIDVTFAMLMIAVPLTVFVSRIPITVWSLGVTEGAGIYLLGLFGVPASEALAIVVGGRIIDLAALLPGALFWMDLVRSPEPAGGGPG